VGEERGNRALVERDDAGATLGLWSAGRICVDHRPTSGRSYEMTNPIDPAEPRYLAADHPDRTMIEIEPLGVAVTWRCDDCAGRAELVPFDGGDFGVVRIRAQPRARLPVAG